MKYLLLVIIFAVSLKAQNQPVPLNVTTIWGLTSTTVIDNRSSLRQNSNHSIYVTGSGSWSVALEYSSAAGGPWTAFDTDTGTISNASDPPIASSFGYHNFIRVNIVSGSGLTINYSAIRTFYINPASGGGGGGSGTVTSVGLSLPNIFSVSGSPVTSAGTLSATLASQLQNLFFASPDGSSGAPTFRALATADLPSTVIFNNVSQAYTSGSKQTFTPSASLAGARLVAGALPSSPSTGDLAIDSGASNLLKVYNGSTWVTSSGGGTSPGACSVNQVVIETTAGGVTCATLIASYLPITIPYTSQTNTYTAGMKQLFSPSATNAGLRIVAGALPSSPAVGDIAIDSGASNALKSYNGSTWVSATGIPAGTCSAGQVVFATTVSGVTCIGMIQTITGDTGTVIINASTGKADIDNTALGAQNLVFTGQFNLSGASLVLPFRHVVSDQSGACTTNGQAVLNTVNGNKFVCIGLLWQRDVSLSTANTYTGGGLQDMGTSVVRLGNLSSEPGTCAIGSTYFNTVSAKTRVCNATNTWSDMGGSIVISNDAANRLCPSNGSGGFNCIPGGGGAVLWTGYIFSIYGKQMTLWGGNGNDATCSTVYTLPDSGSNAIKVTLTGNCTLSSGGVENGMHFTVEVCQDATGGRTLAWPSRYVPGPWLVSGTTTVQTGMVTTANTCSVQTFAGDTVKNKFFAIAPGVTGQ